MSLKAAKNILTLTLLALIWPQLALAVSTIEVKSDSLHYLQNLRSQNVKRLQEIDKTLQKKVEEISGTQVEQEVGNLKAAKREHMLRQEFLDRLIFQVDTKFGGGDLKSFLERALVEMAKVDAIGTQEASLWKFLKYASDAMRRLPEQKENVLSFLEGYMNRSVSNPVRPEEFISSRNYTNGAESEAGSPVDREDVGAFADRRLKELNQKAQPEVSKQN